MTIRNIVVVGTSAGGLKALTSMVSQLPASFPAVVFIVQHLIPDSGPFLTGALQRETSLPVSTARHGEAIEAGHIYVAPADHHLILDNPAVSVVKGPRENR